MGFKFKQFNIDDSECGQKVGTDSIILGSWSDPSAAQSILDIGTGSGLLLLMQAQRARVDASLIGIDLDPKSILVAKQNVANSRWQHIEVMQGDVRTYTPSNRFDLIISNPPYFTHHKGLVSQHQSSRYNARHTQHLSLNALVDCVVKLLSDEGVFRLVIPYDKHEELLRYAESCEMSISKLCRVHSFDLSPPSRVLLEIGFTPRDTHIEKLVIYESEGHYTHQFRELCKVYYLRF